MEVPLDFTQALAIKNDDTDALFYRAMSYYYLKDYDQAIADYTQVIRIHPNDDFAYYNRALAYANKRDYTRAQVDWTEALRLNPNDTDTQNNLEDLRQRGY
jgi:tetratricopeptide (TPR) repeat protein